MLQRFTYHPDRDSESTVAARHHGYTPIRDATVDEFIDSADLNLIAYAMATEATVVTREQPAPDAKRKIKIPDACIAFGVDWTDPFSTYRALGMRLVA